MGAWNILKQWIPSFLVDNNEGGREYKEVKFNNPGLVENLFLNACKRRDKESAYNYIREIVRSKRYDNAIEAWKYFEKVFDEHTGDVEKNIGDIYLTKKDYKKALEHYICAKAMSDNNSSLEEKIYTCCKNLISNGASGETPAYWYNLYTSLFPESSKYSASLKKILK